MVLVPCAVFTLNPESLCISPYQRVYLLFVHIYFEKLAVAPKTWLRGVNFVVAKEIWRKKCGYESVNKSPYLTENTTVNSKRT